MIKKITKISSFGILNDYSADTKPFNKYNIIYGWNGSGKTTLGRLFRCLETKYPNKEFPTAKFSIELYDGTKISSDDPNHNLQVRVFNNDFIAENLNLFDAKTKSIIFLSKEKIDEKKELETKKVEIKGKTEQLKKIQQSEDLLIGKIDKVHQDAGRALKTFLLGTIYANVTYNKATSIKIWPRLKMDDLDKYILNDKGLLIEKNYTLVNSQMPPVSVVGLPQNIEIEKFESITKAVSKLITANITAKVIERLKENSELSDWVGLGLKLHKKLESNICEFCGQNISPERFHTLDEHFSDEYSQLIGQIKIMIDNLTKGLRDVVPDNSNLIYQEVRTEYEQLLNTLNNATIQINEIINQLITALEKKKETPFNVISDEKIDYTLIEHYNSSLTLFVSCIQKHNEISNTHTKHSERAKVKIENHFVALQAKQDKLIEEEKKLERITASIAEQQKDIRAVSERIKFLEGELRNDTIAITELNEHLHKFLGRNDIILEPVAAGGYQLMRGGIAATNLSEGEKTAISLIYFFSKIRENDAILQNQIIVLDDPISSFDSNHLFNASSFVKKYVDGADQLFVLTHNFWFFKQVRDWMKKKNKKDDNGHPIWKSHIYIVERGMLKNAAETLTRFHSEYQHVFYTMLQYKKLDDVDDSICYSIANTARRLLEGFTSFKTPSDSGFEGALALGEKRGLNSEQKERIFFFLNKYSHLDRIESFDNTVEVLLEEGKNVVNDVLWLIKKVDLEHYNSMLKICGIDDPLVQN